jgi:uncharacterized membrane protein (DUF2068 family)
MAKTPHRALRLIAAYKAIKALALLVAAIAAFGLIGDGNLETLFAWVMQLPIHHGHDLLVGTIDKLFGLGPRKFLAIGVVLCIYAAVFLVEGWGLWRERRWAEYLTVIVTASLIPLEVWEIFHHLTWLKIFALIVNVAILLYLIALLRRER